MKQSRWAMSVWLLAIVLATLVLWLGCEHKGDISPTGTGRDVITFIDTVIIEPPVVTPGQNAGIGARILNEDNEPARSESVRFSVNRGMLGGSRADTTVASDQLGWARATYTAPADTGPVLLRTELIGMSELRTSSILVSSVESLEGQLTVWAEHDSLFADNGVSRTTIYARVRNESHNPIGGAVIYLSTTVGSVTSPAITDSVTGTAAATLVSTTEIGQAVVTAWYGSTHDSTQVTFLRPAAASLIEVTSARPQIQAGNDSSAITARVFGENGLPIVDNTVVSFSTSRGTLSRLTARTTGGIATTMLYASPAVGDAVVQATTGSNINGQITVLVVAGPTASITMAVESDTLFADNMSTTVVTAAVRDAFGNPVSEGTPVAFVAQGGTVTESATVGPDGTARATFRAGLAAGPAAVTATQGGIQGAIVIELVSTQAASITLSANPMQLVANGTAQSALRATVLDPLGRPVSDGTPVTFTARYGALSGAGGQMIQRERGPVRTLKSAATDRKSGSSRNRSLDEGFAQAHKTVLNSINSLYTTATAGGYAYATLISPTLVGTDTAAANVQELTTAQVLTYIAGPAARIEVIPSAGELPADGRSSTPVVCRVTDVFGNSVSSGYAISVSTTIGTVNPVSGFTNGNGEFSTTLISSRSRGLAAVVASVEGASGYGEVQFTAPAVAAVVLSTDQPSLLANGISSATLTAQAVDDYGLAVEGATVAWQADPGLGQLIPLTTSTDTLGQAWAVFYTDASHQDAQQHISAACDGHSDSRTLVLRGIAVSAWTGVPTLPADGVSTTDVSVLVRETTNGIAIANAMVLFAANRGSIPQSASTNSSGIATVAYLSDTQAGPVQITAVYGDTLRAQANLQLTGIAGDSLAVVLASGELIADGLSSTTVTAVVYNEGGQVVPNTAVSFAAVGAGVCYPDIVTTDENGVAVSTYQSAALNQDQAVSVDVAIERDDDEKPMMLRGVLLSASAVQNSLPANGSATTQISVDLRRSSTYVAIPNAVVQLGTTLGTIPSSVTTDESGVATATFSAGSVPGDAYIIARYGNLLTDTVMVSLFSPAATSIALSATRTSLLASGVDTTTAVMLAVDQSGAPLQNATVQWTTIGGGSLLYPLSLTDQNGIATNRYTAPAHATDGSTMIISQIGTIGDTVSVGYRGVTLSLSPSVSTLPANGVSTTTISAHLRETTSLMAVSSAMIQFGSSLGQIPNAGETDESGLVSVELTASTTPGVATVIGGYGNLIGDTTFVSFYNPTPHRIVVYADTTLLRADGISSTPVHAFVYDELDVALPNVTVTWSAAGGALNLVQTQTDQSGMTDVIYVSTASTADRSVMITATAGSVSGMTNVIERGITVDVTAIPAMVIADGRSTSEIRAHIYETSTSVAVSNVGVTFGTNLGTIPNSGVTNASGIASAILTSSTTTGTATVTASFGNILSDQVDVAFAPSTPTTLSLTASPTVLPADNESVSTLTAVVTDQNGNPVPDGTQIRFNIPPQSGSIENLRTTVGGVVTNSLTSSTTPDTVNVVVWAEANPTARDSVIVIYTVGEPGVITLSALSDSLRADGISVDTITAHVTDEIGHPLSNVEVQFATTIGNITSSRVTNGSGDAKVALSSSATGVAQITATAGEIETQYSVYLIPGNPNAIELQYFPSSVGVRGSGRNETLLITAIVRDANNNPVLDGTDVYFNINNSPGGGDFLSSTGAIPTINGRATVSYNSGTISGSVRIRARCLSITALSTEILIYAGPPYIESIYSPCDSTHMSLAAAPCNMFGMDVVGDSVTIIALVGDRYNNPVTPGTAVYFTTSGGVITTGTGYTDSSGFARVTLFSGNPLPNIPRWINTLSDPNLGGPILCTSVPPQDGVAKILASTEGVDGNGDSVTVWATTNVIFDYSQPQLFLREVTVNGDPDERTLFIGENALIRIAVYDYDFWPLVSGSEIRCTANHGLTYPGEIVAGCPGDTSYTFSFFNNLSLTDDDAASPVLINVETRYGDAYVFTETFTLRASLPPNP